MINEENYEFQGAGLTRKQKYDAKKRFEIYMEKHSIESYSDMQLLEELIYREIQADSLKEKIKELQESDTVKEKALIPKSLRTQLNDYLDDIIEIKEKLGLFKEKETQTYYKKWQLTKEKFSKWLEENQASREFFCPHCSEAILLIVEKKHWEAKKHPWFEDRRLFNEHAIKLYLKDIITKKDCAKILGTSVDYVDWIIDKSQDNPKFKKMKKEINKKKKQKHDK